MCPLHAACMGGSQGGFSWAQAHAVHLHQHPPAHCLHAESTNRQPVDPPTAVAGSPSVLAARAAHLGHCMNMQCLPAMIAYGACTFTWSKLHSSAVSTPAQCDAYAVPVLLLSSLACPCGSPLSLLECKCAASSWLPRYALRVWCRQMGGQGPMQGQANHFFRCAPRLLPATLPCMAAGQPGSPLSFQLPLRTMLQTHSWCCCRYAPEKIEYGINRYQNETKR